MDDALFVAVDLGAGSGRVFLAGLDEGGLLLEQVRRFRYPPRETAGHLRWDLRLLFDEVAGGLSDAGARAAALGRRLASVGIDSWGVDYGLVDASGELVEDPVCYRDARTRGVMDEVFARVPRAEVVARTGIQCLALNTLFQLYAHAREGIPPRAERLLLIPDLLHCRLTGEAVTEYSNASTTQLVNMRTGAWDVDLANQLGLPSRLLPPIVPAGRRLGPIVPAVARQLALPGVDVVAPATHDTGSAVAGTPLQDGWAYISSGTWSLVGVERETVLVADDVARENLTNEGGVFGTFRFLKNVTGLWVLESCRREWQARGLEVPYDGLLAAAAALDRTPAVVYPDDARFFNPASMLAAIAAQLSETGQSCPDDPPSIARSVLDSLALRYASVLATIARVTGRGIPGVHIVGGGSLNAHLNQATANATRVPVVAGPVEATVIGNAVVQAIAHGRFAGLAAARAHVARHVALTTFLPRATAAFDEAARCYAHVEARYAGV